MQYFLSYKWYSAWFHKFSCIKNYFKNSQKIIKIQDWYSHKVIYLLPRKYMQDKRETPAIVNEKISDLVPDFMNFIASKIILKIHKKYLR